MDYKSEASIIKQSSILRTLYQVTVVGMLQASNAQKMKRVFPMNMVLYVVSEPLILGFKSKIYKTIIFFSSKRI